MDKIAIIALVALVLFGILAISESGPEQAEPQEIIRTYNR